MSKAIAQKLMLKPGQQFLVIDPPDGFLDSLGDLPSGAALAAPTVRKADAVQVFVSSLSDLRQVLPKVKLRVAQSGMLWVTYPKGTGNKPGGINRDVIREYALTIGLQTVSLFAVDSTWSAMRLKIVSPD